MIKGNLFFVILLLSVKLYSQQDRVLSNESSHQWVRVKELPKGMKADSIVARKAGGDWEIRTGWSKRMFTPRELNIPLDGRDATARINWVIQNPVVEGIVLDDWLADSISVLGSVNMKGKKLQSGSIFIGGTGTIDDTYVEGSAAQKIFSPDINLTNVKAEKFYSIWYSVVHDDKTNNIKAFRKFAWLPNLDLWTNSGVAYIGTDSVRFHPSSRVYREVNSRIRSDYKNGAAVTVGPHKDDEFSILNRGRYYDIDVFTRMPNDWRDSTAAKRNTGIRAQDLFGAELSYSAMGFTNNLLLYSSNTKGGFCHTIIWPRESANSWAHIIVDAINNGYVNSNKINDGNIYNHTNINKSFNTARYAMIVGYSDKYHHNNNIWTGGSIQLNHKQAVPFVVNNGLSNHFIGWRNEGNSTIGAIFNGTARSNIVLPGFSFVGLDSGSQSIAINNSPFINTYLDTRDQSVLGALSYPVFQWSAPGNVIGYDERQVSVKGVDAWIQGMKAKQLDAEIGGNWIGVINSNNSIGVTVDADRAKTFMVRRVVVEGDGRVLVTPYDVNGNIITENPLSVKMYGKLWVKSHGGGYTQGGNSKDNDIEFEVSDEVKSVRVLLYRPANGVYKLKGFSVHVVNSREGTSIAGITNQSLVSTGMFRGTLESGMIINKPSGGFWLVAESGTDKRLKGYSGTVNQNVLLLTSGDVNALSEGEYLQIGDAKRRIEKVNNGRVFLDAGLPPFKGAFDYANPVLEEMVTRRVSKY